jgi:hypothetical protein
MNVGTNTMKYLLLMMLSLTLASGCFITSDDSECTYDSDCYYDEECYHGQCVYVPGAPPGAVTVGCNCSSTNYYPGNVRTNYTCESGQDIIQACNYYCCDAWTCYGLAWGAVCL